MLRRGNSGSIRAAAVRDNQFSAVVCAADFKSVRPNDIDTAGDFILRNMAVFFLPSTVGVMNYFSVLAKSWLPFLVIVAVSLVVTFAVTAWVVSLMIKLMNRKRIEA